MPNNQAVKDFEGKLLDFDWQIRHVMGSSTCRNLEETLTQISFLVKGRTPYNDSTTRNITIEFNKTELKKLIDALHNSLKN